MIGRILGTVGVCVLAGTLGACGSSDSTTGTGGGSGGSTLGAGGGAGGGAGAGGACNPLAADQSCPDLLTCAETACSTQIAQCFGTTASTCADYVACTSVCNCVAQCTQSCTKSAACQTCTDAISSCVVTSCAAQALACFNADAGAGGAGGGFTFDAGLGSGTCADLAACCAKAGTNQATCNAALSAAQAGGDAACGIVLSELKTVFGC